MSFSFDIPSVPLARQAALIVVAKYVPVSQINPNGPLYLLPNVVCEEVQIREGADPGSARFRYILNDSDPSLPYPDGLEDLWPIDATGRYVVQNDDRILVYAFGLDGSKTLVHSGFAQIPEGTLSPDNQTVTFQTLGDGIRLWDTPLAGAVTQDANRLDTADNAAGPTDRPIRFNPNGPDGKPLFNAAPAACDIDGSQLKDGTGLYPVFVDPTIATGNPTAVRPWTLGMAVRYLIWEGNPTEKYVTNGITLGLDDFFKSLSPAVGSTYDPRNPATYNLADIVIRDFDASNKPAIESIAALCDAEGFRVQFSQFASGIDGSPTTLINFTRRDGAFGSAPKYLNLQRDGANLDPGLSNVGGLHVARDLAGVFNQVRIETDPVRYEISVVLACGFLPDTADITAANRKAFQRANWQSTTSQDDRNKYRYYIFSEAAESYYSFATRDFVDAPDPADLSGFMLGADGKLGDNGDNRVYSFSFRPGENTLISTGSDGKPLKAQLAISRDYTGPYPALWSHDGGGASGTWQPIAGGWELLKDRLGIYVNIEDPEEWDIGSWLPPGGKVAQNNGKTLRGITSQSSTAGISTFRFNRGNFWLRLTTVIEGDFGIVALANRRAVSPTNFAIERRIDARDHYRKELVHKSSAFFNPTAFTYQPPFTINRDDTPKAQAYAEAIRSANEFGPTAGSVTIPRFSNAYKISDKIAGISGRNINFQTNVTTGTNEGPQYPSVAGIRYTFGSKQETILMLSDRRAEPREK